MRSRDRNNSTGQEQFDQFANGYDRFLWPLEQLIFAQVRRQLIPKAGGNVLELAVGTGVNLPLYQPGTCVIGIDSSWEMIQSAQGRKSEKCTAILQSDAARLPFPTNHFDTIISTLLYCSLDEPAKTLAEIRRVLRPDGCLLMMEHVRGKSPIMGILTDLVNIPWPAITRTCHFNRRPTEDLSQAGFTILAQERQAMSIVQTIIATAAD